MFAYTVPVILLSFIINIPKFLETKIVVRHEIPYVAPSPTTETTVMPLNVNDTSFDSVPTVTGVNFYSIPYST